jgi:hypothetical protein
MEKTCNVRCGSKIDIREILVNGDSFQLLVQCEGNRVYFEGNTSGGKVFGFIPYSGGKLRSTQIEVMDSKRETHRVVLLGECRGEVSLSYSPL